MTKYLILFAIMASVFVSHANNECINAINLMPNTTCNYTFGTFNGMTISSAPPLCASSASQDVWYTFTATDSTMSIELGSQSGLNHGFELIQGGCNGTVLQCVNAYAASYSEYYFNNNFIPGQVYYIRVFNASGGLSTSSFGICVRKYPSPSNDYCSTASMLTPNTSCNYTYGTFSGAMMNGGTPSCGVSSSQDIWYKFTATDSTMSIELGSQSGLNHGFELIQGGCNGTVLQCVNAYAASYSEYYFNNNFIPGQVYYIRVFNASGGLSTSSFGICVRKYPSPSNDYCSTASMLTPNTSCNYTYGTFSGAMMNGGTPSCGVSSSQDIWYKFTATDSTMSIELGSQSGLNHGFELIQGGCNGTVLQCVNAYAASYSEYYFNNNFIPGQVYYIRVFNASGGLSTYSFGICVRKYPSPVNDYCSTASMLTPNTSCNYTYGTFSGAMMNGGTPSCGVSSSQDIWYTFTATDSTMSIELGSQSGLNHGFELIQGGCNGTVLQCVNEYSASYSEYYFNNNFIPGQVYYIRVFNASGGLSTYSFGICVRKYPSPSNDYCSTASMLTPNTSCNYTYGTFSGAMMNGGTPSCGVSSSQDIWYKFTATDSTMSIELGSQSGLNHGFELIQGGCNGTVLQCVNEYSASYSEYYFNNNFIPGQVYYIRVFNASGGLSTFSFGICVRKYPSPVNDECVHAIELTPNTNCTNIYGTFSGAMMNGGVPSCGISTSQDVWYRFIASSTSMSLQLGSASGLNHGFQVFEGSCNGTEILCRNQFIAGYGESASLTTLTIGQTYYVRVINASSGLSTSTFSICLIGTPPVTCTPSVTISASTTTICQGENVVLNAFATYGGNSPSYQWKVNGSNVGTNSSFYSSSTLTNGSVVTCIMASNASCASPTIATSNAITMSVSPATTPTFTPIPTVCYGQPFTLPTTSNNGINGSWSPAANNTSTTTYTFIPSAGQCSASGVTMTVTVNSNLTIPTFTQVPAICSGGSFTIPSTSNNGITGSWSPAINNTATTTYTFTPTAGQCASTTTMTVTVTNTTTPVFSQIPAICSGGSFTLPLTSNNGITGSWSPAINNTVTTTYTFTPTAGQCASTTTMTVTVTNTTTPVFSQIPAICSGESFTLPSTSNNGITGSWSPAINNTATTTYTFTPTAGQCASTTTMTVTVTNTTTPVFSQIPAICSGESFTLPSTSNNGITGSWSPAINNTATTTYTFTPTAGQCASTTTMTVTVTNTTTPVFSQIPAICSGGSFTLPSTSNDGIAGSWSPAINNMATTTYTFTPTSGQCVETVTMTVVIHAVNTSLTTQGNTITASATGASYHWINCINNQLINGATNASFTPTENGLYAVIVTQNGCSDTSNCIAITTLGMETLVENGWKVYPNPANDQLFVELGEASEIVITDMMGKMVRTEMLKPGNQLIDIRSFTPGIYFIRSESSANVKFVKE